MQRRKQGAAGQGRRYRQRLDQLLGSDGIFCLWYWLRFWLLESVRRRRLLMGEVRAKTKREPELTAGVGRRLVMESLRSSCVVSWNLCVLHVSYRDWADPLFLPPARPPSRPLCPRSLGFRSPSVVLFFYLGWIYWKRFADERQERERYCRCSTVDDDVYYPTMSARGRESTEGEWRLLMDDIRAKLKRETVCGRESTESSRFYTERPRISSGTIHPLMLVSARCLPVVLLGNTIRVVIVKLRGGLESNAASCRQ